MNLIRFSSQYETSRAFYKDYQVHINHLEAESSSDSCKNYTASFCFCCLSMSIQINDYVLKIENFFDNCIRAILMCNFCLICAMFPPLNDSALNFQQLFSCSWTIIKGFTETAYFFYQVMILRPDYSPS